MLSERAFRRYDAVRFLIMCVKAVRTASKGLAARLSEIRVMVYRCNSWICVQVSRDTRTTTYVRDGNERTNVPATFISFILEFPLLNMKKIIRAPHYASTHTHTHAYTRYRRTIGGKYKKRCNADIFLISYSYNLLEKKHLRIIHFSDNFTQDLYRYELVYTIY